MADKQPLSSPIVALLTPFGSDGEIDFGAFGAYLEYLRGHGVEAVVANGTTSEFAALSLAERMKLLEYCREHFTGAIVQNVSSCSLKDVAEMLAHAEPLADAVLMLPPYYLAQPQQGGVAAFFDATLSMTKLPLLIYNFPRHTQVDIAPELVVELADRHANLLGIKDSTGRVENAQRFAGARAPFSIYVGNDRVSYDVLVAGLAGSVTGAGSSFPECLVAIRRHFLANEHEAAQAAQALLNRWNAWRDGFGNDEISVTKYVLSRRIPGYPTAVRQPLCPLPAQQAAQVAEKVAWFEPLAAQCGARHLPSP